MYSSASPKTLESDLEADTHQDWLIQETKRLDIERKSIHSEIKSLLHEITFLDKRTTRLRRERHMGLFDPLYSTCTKLLKKLENVTENAKTQVELKEINKIIELMPFLDKTKHSEIIMLQDQLIHLVESNLLQINFNHFKFILRQLSEFGLHNRESINDKSIEKFLMLLIQFPEYQSEIFENNATCGREFLKLDKVEFLLYKINFKHNNARKLYDLVDNHTAKMQIVYARMVTLLDAEFVLQKEKDKTKEILPPVLLNIVLDYLGSVDIQEFFVLTLIQQEPEVGKILYKHLMNNKQIDNQEMKPADILLEKIVTSSKEEKFNYAKNIILEYKKYNPNFLETIFSKPIYYGTFDLMAILQPIAMDECKPLLVKYQDNLVNCILYDNRYKMTSEFSCYPRFSPEKASFILNFKIKELDDIFIKTCQNSKSTETDLKFISQRDISIYGKNQLYTVFRKSVPLFDDRLKTKENLLQQINTANAQYKGVSEEQFKPNLLVELDVNLILLMFLQHRNLLAYKHENNINSNSITRFISGKITTSRLVRLYDKIIINFQETFPELFRNIKIDDMQQNAIKLTTHRGQLSLPSIKIKEIQKKRFWQN